MDKEHKKMLKDYVKSMTKYSPLDVITWTAGDLQEYDFDKYSLESIFDEGTLNHELVIKNTSILIWYTKRSIKLGKIFLRSRKVDPLKPARYRENGWAIRNQSTRDDKTAFGRSMSFLSTKPTLKSKFLDFLKHR